MDVSTQYYENVPQRTEEDSQPCFCATPSAGEALTKPGSQRCSADLPLLWESAGLPGS